MKTTIPLYKDELESILEILKKFPDVDKIELRYQGGAIGGILDMSFPYKVNEVDTTQIIEISGVDKW